VRHSTGGTGAHRWGEAGLGGQSNVTELYSLQTLLDPGSFSLRTHPPATVRHTVAFSGPQVMLILRPGPQAREGGGTYSSIKLSKVLSHQEIVAHVLYRCPRCHYTRSFWHAPRCLRLHPHCLGALLWVWSERDDLDTQGHEDGQSLRTGCI
jgi:hypothetical protein